MIYIYLGKSIQKANEILEIEHWMKSICNYLSFLSVLSVMYILKYLIQQQEIGFH